MKRENINYFIVGLFVIVIMFVLLVALYRISGGSTDADQYFVELKNVAGIREGSPVTYSGYQIGSIPAS